MLSPPEHCETTIPASHVDSELHGCQTTWLDAEHRGKPQEVWSMELTQYLRIQAHANRL
jgi:hypothetical protein